MLFVSNILDFRFIPLFISKEAYSYSINGFTTYEFIGKILIKRKVFPIGCAGYLVYPFHIFAEYLLNEQHFPEKRTAFSLGGYPWTRGIAFNQERFGERRLVVENGWSHFFFSYKKGGMCQ
jgi:hypothetical protein